MWSHRPKSPTVQFYVEVFENLLMWYAYKYQNDAKAKQFSKYDTLF
jgi:hypothetical protein